MSSPNTTDKAALWAQLQEIQEKEMKDVKEEREKLEKEKESMKSVTADPSDIVEINVGGEAIIQSHRSTLCLAPDAMFSNLFSGRWDDSCARDSQGRVFLDHDPELVRLIVNHLRIKKIEDPSKPIRGPKIPQGKQDEFILLLTFFGLLSFFYPNARDTIDCSEITAVPPLEGCNKVCMKRKDLSLQFTYNDSGHYFVACTPSLPNGNGCCWKVTIDTLPNNHWVYLGVIGTLAAEKISYSNSTSYGWAGKGQVWRQGKKINNKPEWSGFVAGECLYFRYKGNKLTMFSANKNATYSIDDIETSQQMYIHFNFFDNETKLLLAPVTADELPAVMHDN